MWSFNAFKMGCHAIVQIVLRKLALSRPGHLPHVPSRFHIFAVFFFFSTSDTDRPQNSSLPRTPKNKSRIDLCLHKLWFKVQMPGNIHSKSFFFLRGMLDQWRVLCFINFIQIQLKLFRRRRIWVLTRSIAPFHSRICSEDIIKFSSGRASFEVRWESLWNLWLDSSSECPEQTSKFWDLRQLLPEI